MFFIHKPHLCTKTVGCVFIVPAGCDGCRGDPRRRVCRGSSYPSSGTFPGLWLSPTTGSQSCHPRVVWRPHTHTSQGIIIYKAIYIYIYTGLILYIHSVQFINYVLYIFNALLCFSAKHTVHNTHV